MVTWYTVLLSVHFLCLAMADMLAAIFASLSVVVIHGESMTVSFYLNFYGYIHKIKVIMIIIRKT